MTKKRKYQEIWERAKSVGFCEIIIGHPVDAARIRKAVIKEKDMDLSFKLMNDIDPPRLHIIYDKRVGKMKFVVRQTLNIVKRVVV